MAQKLEVGDFPNEVFLSLSGYVVSDVDFCGQIGDENGSRPVSFAESALDESDFLDEICVVWVVVWRGAIFHHGSSKVNIRAGSVCLIDPPPKKIG